MLMTLLSKGPPWTTNQTAPNQFTMPLNKLPWAVAFKCSGKSKCSDPSSPLFEEELDNFGFNADFE